MSYKKKLFLKILQYSQKNTCAGVTSKKQTPTQVYSYEYFKIFKNTYFEKQLGTAGSDGYSSVFHVEPGCKRQKMLAAQTWSKFALLKLMKNIRTDEKG